MKREFRRKIADFHNSFLEDKSLKCNQSRTDLNIVLIKPTKTTKLKIIAQFILQTYLLTTLYRMTAGYMEHPAVNTMGSLVGLISRNFKFIKSQLVGQFKA